MKLLSKLREYCAEAAAVVGTEHSAAFKRQIISCIACAPPASAHALSARERNILTREAAVAEYLVNHANEPNITVRQIEAALDIPHATVARTYVWKVYKATKSSRQLSSKIRTIPLTPEMLAVIADPSAEDPAQAVEELDREAELARLIAEQARDAQSDGW